MKAWEEKRCSRHQIILFGLYFDYHRFLYFVLLPVIRLIALEIDPMSRFFSRIIDTHLFITKRNSPIKNKSGCTKLVLRLMPHLNCKFTFLLLLSWRFLAFAVKCANCFDIFLFDCSATYHDYHFSLQFSRFQSFV
jgi:hypothetical protein